MSSGCERCQKLKLRCFVDASSGQCAGCISVHAECSLWIPEKDWERVQAEKRRKRLELLRAEAEAARLRVELAEVEEQELSYARHDRRVADTIDALEKQKEDPKGTAANDIREPSQPVLSATDLGWLQADPSSSFDPSLSFDFSCFLDLPDSMVSIPCSVDIPGTTASVVPLLPRSTMGSARGSPVPTSCSS